MIIFFSRKDGGIYKNRQDDSGKDQVNDMVRFVQKNVKKENRNIGIRNKNEIQENEDPYSD